MLVIRRAQLEQISAQKALDALGLLRSHARTHFGDSLADVDDARLDAFLGRIVQQAATFGLDSERHVLLFLNLALTFGELFLERPELAWMRRMLADPEISSPGERMDRLYREAVDWLRKRGPA